MGHVLSTPRYNHLSAKERDNLECVQQESETRWSNGQNGLFRCRHRHHGRFIPFLRFHPLLELSQWCQEVAKRQGSPTSYRVAQQDLSKRNCWEGLLTYHILSKIQLIWFVELVHHKGLWTNCDFWTYYWMLWNTPYYILLVECERQHVPSSVFGWGRDEVKSLLSSFLHRKREWIFVFLFLRPYLHKALHSCPRQLMPVMPNRPNFLFNGTILTPSTNNRFR